MNILRAEHLGMCFGVRDAIALALRTGAPVVEDGVEAGQHQQRDDGGEDQPAHDGARHRVIGRAVAADLEAQRESLARQLEDKERQRADGLAQIAVHLNSIAKLKQENEQTQAALNDRTVEAAELPAWEVHLARHGVPILEDDPYLLDEVDRQDPQLLHLVKNHQKILKPPNGYSATAKSWRRNWWYVRARGK